MSGPQIAAEINWSALYCLHCHLSEIERIALVEDAHKRGIFDAQLVRSAWSLARSWHDLDAGCDCVASSVVQVHADLIAFDIGE